MQATTRAAVAGAGHRWTKNGTASRALHRAHREQQHKVNVKAHAGNYQGGGGCGSSCIGAAPLPPGACCACCGTASRGACCCPAGCGKAPPGIPAAVLVGAAAAGAGPAEAAGIGLNLSLNL